MTIQIKKKLYWGVSMQDSKVDSSHYDVFKVKLTKKEIEQGFIRLDPYRVAHEWL